MDKVTINRIVVNDLLKWQYRAKGYQLWGYKEPSKNSWF